LITTFLSLRLSAGAIAYLIILSIFFYFALNGLKKSVSQEYMSLSADSGICEPIKKSISDTFTVDANGIWKGQTGYTFSLEQYTFIANQLEVTDQQYKQILLLAEQITNALGKQALNFDLSQILLYWTSWQLYCDADHPICEIFQSQIFSLSGDSKVHDTFPSSSPPSFLLPLMMPVHCSMFLPNHPSWVS
jgi:hypothetical protein